MSTEVIATNPKQEAARSFASDAEFAIAADTTAQAAWQEFLRTGSDYLPFKLWIYIKSSDLSTRTGHVAVWIDRSFDHWVTQEVFADITLRAEDSARPLQPGGSPGIPGIYIGWDGRDSNVRVTVATSSPAEIGIAYQIISPPEVK